MKILFQGDSITDAGRDRRNYHQLGNGYPKYAAQAICETFPQTEFEFINLGISGNRIMHLYDRLYPDAIAFQPDIVSVLIGINDIGGRYASDRAGTTDEQIECNYRAILERLHNQTNAKILMLSPFLPAYDPALSTSPSAAWIAKNRPAWREDLKTVLPIVRKLADQYADKYIPLDLIFEEHEKDPITGGYYSADGMHPNEAGARLIGKIYAETVEKWVESIRDNHERTI